MTPSPDPIARLTATGHPWSVHYNPHAARGPAYVVAIGGATGGGRTLEDAIGAALDRLAGQRIQPLALAGKEL